MSNSHKRNQKGLAPMFGLPKGACRSRSRSTSTARAACVVAVAELCEATSDCAAIVKPKSRIWQEGRTTCVPGTYPLRAFNWAIGFALTASPFCQTATKGTKKALPRRSAFAALRFPRSGPAPRARRDGPSLARHGFPGIHAGQPSTQNLLSACRKGLVDQDQDQDQQRVRRVP